MPENIKATEITAEIVRVPARVGYLEGILAYPSADEPAGMVVIVGPHPLLGGDMQNNVVDGLGNGLAERGLVSLRFNYAGVGGSDGAEFLSVENLESFWRHSHTDSERDRWKDLDSAVRFARDVAATGLPLGLVAYSFGNCVTARWLAQVTRRSVENVPAWIVCIAPTVDTHDLRGLADSESAKLVIAPADDFATPISSVTHKTESWKSVAETMITRRDGHFFRGHESWLCRQCFDFAHGSREAKEVLP